MDLVGNKKKIELPEEHVSRRAYAIVYDWMILPEGESSRLLRRDNILEIFRAAQFLKISELQQQCWAFLDNEEMFAEDTAFLMYLQAKKAGHMDVMQIMVPRIQKFFLCLVSSRDYIELNIDELCMLLRSNYISVHSEMEVFMAAVRWLMFEWPSRQKYVEEVMSCIRFGHVSPWTLVDIRRNPRNPPFLEVTNFKEVHTMIDDGLAFAIVKYWYASCPEDYAHWISILGITEPIGRNWIAEPVHYITYDEFLEDLHYYRRMYLNDLKHAKAGKKVNGKYYQLPVLPPKENNYPHEMGSPSEPSTAHHAAIPTDLAHILEQRKARIKSQKPQPRSGKEPELSKHKTPVPVLVPVVDNNNIESEIRVVDLSQNLSSEANLYDKEQQKKVAQGEPYESKHYLPPEAMPQSAIVVPVRLADNKPGNIKNSPVEKKHSPQPPTKTQAPPQDSYSMARRQERAMTDRKPSPQYIQTSQQQQVIVAPMRASGSQPFHTKQSRDDHNPEEELRNPYKPHEIHPTGSKTRWYKNSHMSQSILGPQNKNYLRDNSLFFAEREAVLVLGGIDPHSPYGVGRNTGKDMYRFQPETNNWDLIGELPEPRHHHSVAFLKGRVFLAGGADPRDDDTRGKSVVVSTVWSFEPVTRSWFSETGMLTPRKNFGLVVSNGKLYAIGGQDRRGKVLSSVESFDPSVGRWKEVAPTKIARVGMACTKYRDMIWVAGGMTNSEDTPLTSTVECYDTRRNVWTFGTPLRFPRCFGRFFAMNDVLYLIGGAGRISQKAHSTASIADIDVWDFNSKTWILKAELVIPRHGHSLAYLGSQILIIGGVTTAYMRALNNIECYCCKRDTWIRGVTALPLTLSGQGSITLPPASLL